jgi:hypothetical protein
MFFLRSYRKGKDWDPPLTVLTPPHFPVWISIGICHGLFCVQRFVVASSWYWLTVSWYWLNVNCERLNFLLIMIQCQTRTWWGVLDATLCDQVCQWLAAGRCTPVSSTNTTDRHHITEILLKVALNTITLTQDHKECYIEIEYLQILLFCQ